MKQNEFYDFISLFHFNYKIGQAIFNKKYNDNIFKTLKLNLTIVNSYNNYDSDKIRNLLDEFVTNLTAYKGVEYLLLQDWFFKLIRHNNQLIDNNSDNNYTIEQILLKYANGVNEPHEPIEGLCFLRDLDIPPREDIYNNFVKKIQEFNPIPELFIKLSVEYYNTTIYLLEYIIDLLTFLCYEKGYYNILYDYKDFLKNYDFIKIKDFFHTEANDKIQNDKIQNDKILPKELTTPKAKKLLDKAIEYKLLEDGYKWSSKLMTKRELAYLCYVLSNKLELSSIMSKTDDGRNETNWKPFKELFNDNNLNNNLRGITTDDISTNTMDKIKGIYDF